MKPLFTALKIIAILLVFSVLIACKKTQQEKGFVSPDRLVIHGAGAIFPQPLDAHWIEEYKKVNSDVDFVYEDVGSGEGIQRFITETVDFGASDAAMTDDEITQVERGVCLVPVTAGMGWCRPTILKACRAT
jgi:phosphate transport system substrate-binding protein